MFLHEFSMLIEIPLLMYFVHECSLLVSKWCKHCANTVYAQRHSPPLKKFIFFEGAMAHNPKAHPCSSNGGALNQQVENDSRKVCHMV